MTKEKTNEPNADDLLRLLLEEVLETKSFAFSALEKIAKGEKLDEPALKQLRANARAAKKDEGPKAISSFMSRRGQQS